jgi:hypothetical protein
MSASSNYLENKVLDHVLGEGARNFTSPATIYLGLFNNTSGNAAVNLEAGILTDEISDSGTAYARQGVNFSAAVNGVAATADTVTWPTATDDWGTVTHVAVLDASTTGNVLFWGELTTSKLIENGDTFQITSNNLTVTLT